MDAVEKANSGHPGMPMGMADVATVLFKNFLKFNSSNPSWINRDRFVLSAGHGSMLLYSLLYLTGYKSISISQIRSIFPGRSPENARKSSSKIHLGARLNRLLFDKLVCRKSSDVYTNFFPHMNIGFDFEV